MLQRIVYFSRNQIGGTPDHLHSELQQILATARRNNGKMGVTGALIFNSGGFAQVLEGEAPAVAAIFERIQRDARHNDVVVIDYENVEQRTFPDWSMGYIGEKKIDQRMFGALSEQSGFNASRFLASDVLEAMLRLVAEEESLVAAE